MKNNFVSYLRISVQKSGGLDSNGIASQRQTVARFIASQNATGCVEHVEVESGKYTDADRPELAKALEYARKHKATLVIAKLDRLSRNAEFLLKLQNSGIDFICCDCPNADKFTVGILALVAQRERELTSERTKNALAIVRAKGVKLGNPNVKDSIRNLNDGARKAKSEFAAKVLPIIESIRRTGIDTLQGIADCLNARGIQTRQGREFSPVQVSRILSLAA